MTKSKDKAIEQADRVLDREAAAECLGIKLSALDKLLQLRKIPSAIKNGKRVFSERRLKELEPGSEGEDTILRRRYLEIEFKETARTALEVFQENKKFWNRALKGEKISLEQMDEARERMEKVERAFDDAERQLFEDAGLAWLLAPKADLDEEDKGTPEEFTVSKDGGSTFRKYAIPPKKKPDLSRQVTQYPHMGLQEPTKGRR